MTHRQRPEVNGRNLLRRCSILRTLDDPDDLKAVMTPTTRRKFKESLEETFDDKRSMLGIASLWMI